MNNLEEKIYNKVIEISETTAKQEVRLENIDKHLKGINGKTHDHCGRIKVLEAVKNKNAGIIIGVAGVISIFWTVITYIA